LRVVNPVGVGEQKVCLSFVYNLKSKVHATSLAYVLTEIKGAYKLEKYHTKEELHVINVPCVVCRPALGWVKCSDEQKSCQWGFDKHCLVSGLPVLF